ncbi:MAG: phosphatidate cytidylyltransferase [Gammaproteobacteria bacterium]|nr:phosphatidate cytidylyltransferase [Gammaproteobacteria bacterium]
MKTRIITGLSLLPLLLAAIIYLPPIYFSVLIGGLVMLGAWEWSLLAGFTSNKSRMTYVVCVTAGIAMAAFFSQLITLLIALFIWTWVLVAIVNYERNGMGAGFQFSVLRALGGFIALIATWVSIVTLETDPNFGPSWLILVLLITFGADVGAYFTGNFFGKNKFCPRVSPNKTWEGFFGGLFLSIFIAAIGGLFLSLSFQQYVILLLLSVATALFSVVGDLGVSLLKRIVNIKDSGNIIPGHGGILDRMDSIAAATVVFLFGALLFGL